MTARQAKLKAKRRAERQRKLRKVLRNAAKVILVLLAEMMTAAAILLVQTDVYTINGFGFALIFLVGWGVSMVLWSDRK